MKLQSSRSFRRAVEEGRWKLERFPWLGRNVGLVLSWLQRAGVCANEATGQKKKKGLLSIFADHCGFVTGQRLRRACQIGELYSNLYSERTKRTLVGNIWRRFQSKHAPSGKLVAALAGVFMWENEKIQDEDIRRFEIFILNSHVNVSADFRVRNDSVIFFPYRICGWSSCQYIHDHNTKQRRYSEKSDSSSRCRD